MVPVGLILAVIGLSRMVVKVFAAIAASWGVAMARADDGT